MVVVQTFKSILMITLEHQGNDIGNMTKSLSIYQQAQSIGFHFHEDFIKDFEFKSVASIDETIDFNTFRLKILDSDLRKQPFVVPYFPSDQLHTLTEPELKGLNVLQIVSIVNVSESSRKQTKQHAHPHSVYRLSITDGHNKVNCITTQPIPQLTIETPPGTKFLYSGGLVLNGYLFLNSDNFSFLGGKVAHLLEAFVANQNAQRVRSMQERGGSLVTSENAKMNKPSTTSPPSFQPLPVSAPLSSSSSSFTIVSKASNLPLTTNTTTSSVTSTKTSNTPSVANANNNNIKKVSQHDKRLKENASVIHPPLPPSTSQPNRPPGTFRKTNKNIVHIEAVVQEISQLSVSSTHNDNRISSATSGCGGNRGEKVHTNARGRGRESGKEFRQEQEHAHTRMGNETVDKLERGGRGRGGRNSDGRVERSSGGRGRSRGNHNSQQESHHTTNTPSPNAAEFNLMDFPTLDKSIVSANSTTAAAAASARDNKGNGAGIISHRSVNSKPWMCQECTFSNDPGLNYCEMCELPRK